MQKTLRISFWSGAAILAVASISTWIAIQHSERLRRQSEYADHRKALLSDPFIMRVLEENRQQCSDPYVYVWSGGVSLRLQRPSGYTRCSTIDTPWFAGALTISPGSSDYRSWEWPQVSRYFLYDDENCREETCATMSIVGGPESAHSIPWMRRKAPVSLSEDPDWPDFESVLTYGTWQEGAWAEFQGTTVRFFFGQGELGDLKGYQPPVWMYVQHPRYPVLMAVGLPPDQRETWKASLQTALSLIDDSVVSVEKLDDEFSPPPSVRFLARLRTH